MRILSLRSTRGDHALNRMAGGVIHSTTVTWFFLVSKPGRRDGMITAGLFRDRRTEVAWTILGLIVHLQDYLGLRLTQSFTRLDQALGWPARSCSTDRDSCPLRHTLR